MTFISYLNNKKNYAIFFLLYLASNFFMILNVDGKYWDDWWILGVEQSILDQVFYHLDGDAGAVRARMIGFLSQVGNGVLVFRILTFMLYFGVVLSVFKILQTISALSKEDVFFVTLIFMLTPLNSAKALAVSVFPYAVSLFIFFIGFYLLSRNLSSNNLFIRFLILILFFASFLTNSLLVFYAVPLIYLFYQKYHNQSNTFFNNFRVFIKQNLDFVFLPFVFFVVRSIFFKPSGLNYDYNSFDWHMILSMPITILISFYSSFLEPISQSLTTFTPFWIFGLLVFLLPFGDKSDNLTGDKKHYLRFLLLGCLFFVLAVFPYLAVSKLPQLGDFASRHQLLIPLGFAFILYFFIKFFAASVGAKNQLTTQVLWIFILAFTAQNIYINYQYKLDWFYQVGLEEHIKDMDIFENNTTFVVDMEHDLLQLRHIMNEGEHSHRLKKIFGNEKRLMMDKSEVEKVLNNSEKSLASASKSWVYSEQEPVYIRITKGRLHRKIFFYEFFDQEKFKFFAKKLIYVEQVNKNPN